MRDSSANTNPVPRSVDRHWSSHICLFMVFRVKRSFSPQSDLGKDLKIPAAHMAQVLPTNHKWMQVYSHYHGE